MQVKFRFFEIDFLGYIFMILSNVKRDAFIYSQLSILYIALTLFIFNVICFAIGRLGIGNDILGFMTGRGRFDDFYNVFSFAPILPNPNIPIQYTALGIIFGRAFVLHQLIGLLIILIVGILLPIYVMHREIRGYFNKNSSIYLFFLLSSYPVLFAFSRGNPTLIGAFWSIAGILTFASGNLRLSRSAFIIGSLFHPVPALFSVLFLRDGIASFAKIALPISVIQLTLYSVLGKPLLEVLTIVSMSLDNYKAGYIIGSAGDLYNNSLFILFKIFFVNDVQVLNFALKVIPLFVFSWAICNTYKGYKIYGKNSAFLMFGAYFLPICLVITSPVSADYRLTYLLIPVALMLLTRSLGLPLFLLLAVLIPKHFIFFSTSWLSIHPDATFVYPNLNNIEITLNSLLNPPLLLTCLFISNASIMKFIHKLSNIRVANVC